MYKFISFTFHYFSEVTRALNQAADIPHLHTGGVTKNKGFRAFIFYFLFKYCPIRYRQRRSAPTKSLSLWYILCLCDILFAYNNLFTCDTKVRLSNVGIRVKKMRQYYFIYCVFIIFVFLHIYSVFLVMALM